MDFQNPKDKMKGVYGDMVYKGWIEIPKKYLKKDFKKNGQVYIFNFLYNTHFLESNYNSLDYPQNVYIFFIL